MLITLAFALQVAAALPETTQPTGPVGAEACVASAAPCLIAPAAAASTAGDLMGNG